MDEDHKSDRHLRQEGHHCQGSRSIYLKVDTDGSLE